MNLTIHKCSDLKFDTPIPAATRVWRLYVSRLQALGRFIRHLYPVLEDRNRKLLARHRGQPQPEVLVHRVRTEIFAESLQLGQPRNIQVAVLQVHLCVVGFPKTRGWYTAGVKRGIVRPRKRQSRRLEKH